jgi:hypothetical protein
MEGGGEGGRGDLEEPAFGGELGWGTRAPQDRSYHVCCLSTPVSLRAVVVSHEGRPYHIPCS